MEGVQQEIIPDAQLENHLAELIAEHPERDAYQVTGSIYAKWDGENYRFFTSMF